MDTFRGANVSAKSAAFIRANRGGRARAHTYLYCIYAPAPAYTTVERTNARGGGGIVRR